MIINFFILKFVKVIIYSFQFIFCLLNVIFLLLISKSLSTNNQLELKQKYYLPFIKMEGKKINYTVFNKDEVDPNDTSCVEEIPGKENKRVVTIITCTNDSKKRVIVQAEAN